MPENNDNGIWKWTTSFLSGIVVAMVGNFIIAPKNLVTREDLTAAVVAQQKEIDQQGRDIQDIKSSITTLDVNIGKIAEHIALQEARHGK